MEKIGQIKVRDYLCATGYVKHYGQLMRSESLIVKCALWWRSLYPMQIPGSWTTSRKQTQFQFDFY
jgi:hypothetical protein